MKKHLPLNALARVAVNQFKGEIQGNINLLDEDLLNCNFELLSIKVEVKEQGTENTYIISL